jgi:TRAP-type mannitol/chloroaromatic compound transport system permease large subunit
MDPVTIGILALIGFIVFMFLGLPVPISMLLFSVVGMLVMKSPAAAFQAVASDIFTNFASYTLTVAPIFGLMGFLASYPGIGESLFNAADKFIGHKRGGIASSSRSPARCSERSAAPSPPRWARWLPSPSPNGKAQV